VHGDRLVAVRAAPSSSWYAHHERGRVHVSRSGVECDETAALGDERSGVTASKSLFYSTANTDKGVVTK
jgi:hypothetical protein